MTTIHCIFDFIQEKLSLILVLLAPFIYLYKVFITRNSKQIEIKTKVFYEKKFDKLEVLNMNAKEHYSDLWHLINLLENGALLPIGLKVTSEKVSSNFFIINKNLNELEFYCCKDEKDIIKKCRENLKKIYELKINLLASTNLDTNESIKINKPKEIVVFKIHANNFIKSIDLILGYNYKTYSR